MPIRWRYEPSKSRARLLAPDEFDIYEGSNKIATAYDVVAAVRLVDAMNERAETRFNLLQAARAAG